MAFIRPGSLWNTVTVLAANGYLGACPPSRTADNAGFGFAKQPGVVAIPGDFDKDGRTDIAFHRPGSARNTMPVLFANGNRGGWTPKNTTDDGAANQPRVVAIPDYYDVVRRRDIPF